MVKAQRPMRAFFYWLMLAAVAHATPPALTTITDVIYRGDGTPASGTLRSRQTVMRGQMVTCYSPGRTFMVAVVLGRSQFRNLHRIPHSPVRE